MHACTRAHIRAHARRTPGLRSNTFNAGKHRAHPHNKITTRSPARPHARARVRAAHRPGTRAHLPRAQLIGLVFVLIFAVLGREFFSERAPGAFGTFDVSLVTLFTMVSTLQQWPDDLPLIFASESEEVYYDNIKLYNDNIFSHDSSSSCPTTTRSSSLRRCMSVSLSAWLTPGSASARPCCSCSSLPFASLALVPRGHPALFPVSTSALAFLPSSRSPQVSSFHYVVLYIFLSLSWKRSERPYPSLPTHISSTLL